MRGDSVGDSSELLYLSSTESYRFSGVFECRVRERFVFEAGNPALLVELSPKLPGSDFGRSGDVGEFVVASRLEGLTVDDLSHMPIFVHLALPPVGWSPAVGPPSSEGFQVVAWAELYRTREDAQAHRMEPRG